MFRRFRTIREEFTEVVDIKVLDGYTVWVRFHDGTSGEADLSEYCDKPFSAEIWADRKKFESAYLEHGVPKKSNLYLYIMGISGDSWCFSGTLALQ